jgi:hypothetical protein
LKLVKFVAFVLGFVLVFQGVSPVQALTVVQSVAAPDFGAVGGPIGNMAKKGLQYRDLFKVHAPETFKDFRQEMAVGYTYSAGVYFGGESLFKTTPNKPLSKTDTNKPLKKVTKR